jgi:hypothetical protein
MHLRAAGRLAAYPWRATAALMYTTGAGQMTQALRFNQNSFASGNNNWTFWVL